MRFISTALAFLFVATSASASGVAEDDPVLRALRLDLMSKMDDLSSDRDALKLQVKALAADRDAINSNVRDLSADRDNLKSQVEALTHEVVSLKNKMSKFPTVPGGSSKHVRRGLQGNEDDMSMSSLADDLGEPEELSFGAYHELVEKVEALFCCIDYNPSNGGTCYVGGDADAVKVRANDYVYLGAGQGHSDDKSGLKIADDVKLFSTDGRIDVDAGTDLELRADVNQWDYEDGSVHVSTKGGDINVHAGKDLVCKADVNQSDGEDGSVHVSTMGGDINVLAGKNLTCRADVNEDDDQESMAYIGRGDGRVRHKSGLIIAPNNGLGTHLFSNGRIFVSAWTNLVMRAALKGISNMIAGEKIRAYLGTGDNGEDDDSDAYFLATKTKANNEDRAKVFAEFNVLVASDKANNGVRSKCGNTNAQNFCPP